MVELNSRFEWSRQDWFIFDVLVGDLRCGLLLIATTVISVHIIILGCSCKTQNRKDCVTKFCLSLKNQTPCCLRNIFLRKLLFHCPDEQDGFSEIEYSLQHTSHCNWNVSLILNFVRFDITWSNMALPEVTGNRIVVQLKYKKVDQIKINKPKICGHYYMT